MSGVDSSRKTAWLNTRLPVLLPIRLRSRVVSASATVNGFLWERTRIRGILLDVSGPGRSAHLARVGGGDDGSEVLRRRLATQGLLTDRPTAPDVVRRLACVQSQEWAHAFWSLGQRTGGTTYAQVRAEFDAGSFVRTHILRPTWHFVAAEDLGWISEVTAPAGPSAERHHLPAVPTGPGAAGCGDRNHRRGSGRRAVPDPRRARPAARRGGCRPGVSGDECRAGGGDLQWSDPRRQHTYALVAERVADPARGDLAELAGRFFIGHGPASVRTWRAGPR